MSKTITNNKFHKITKIKIIKMTKIRDNLIINKITNKLVIILMKYPRIKTVLFHNQRITIHKIKIEILIRIMINLVRPDKTQFRNYFFKKSNNNSIIINKMNFKCSKLIQIMRRNSLILRVFIIMKKRLTKIMVMVMVSKIEIFDRIKNLWVDQIFKIELEGSIVAKNLMTYSISMIKIICKPIMGMILVIKRKKSNLI